MRVLKVSPRNYKLGKPESVRLFDFRHNNKVGLRKRWSTFDKKSLCNKLGLLTPMLVITPNWSLKFNLTVCSQHASYSTKKQVIDSNDWTTYSDMPE